MKYNFIQSADRQCSFKSLKLESFRAFDIKISFLFDFSIARCFFT